MTSSAPSPITTPRHRVVGKTFERTLDHGSDVSSAAFSLERKIEGLEALARALNRQPAELVAAMGTDPAASYLLGNVSDAELDQLHHHFRKPAVEKPPFSIQNHKHHTHTHHTQLGSLAGFLPGFLAAGFLAGFLAAPPSAGPLVRGF